MRDETKILLTTQLAEGIPCGRIVNLLNQSVKETLLEMLKVRTTGTDVVELSVGLPPMRKVCCSLYLREKW